MARVNADVSRNIADRFAGIMQAAAEVIRAADGAGIVARQPLELPIEEELPEDDEEEGEGEPTFAGLAAQILPMIQMWLQVKQAKATATGSETSTLAATPRNAMPSASQMAHLLEAQKLLTPEEAAVARATAAKLSPQDQAELLAELETMTVQQAAAFVRSMLPKMKGAAS
jgi:hypothetical protein